MSSHGHDTLSLKVGRLATTNHSSEVESIDCSLYEPGKKITSIGMGNAGVGVGNLYCSSPVLFSLTRITSSIKHQSAVIKKLL